jgi:guanidinoacetate N-methyltransferase
LVRTWRTSGKAGSEEDDGERLSGRAQREQLVSDMDERTYPQGKKHWRSLGATITDERLDIGEFQVMQRWEEPLMRAMAQEAMRNGGDILEVGFRMGISAGMVMEMQPRSYTVIEAHPDIAARARKWGASQSSPVTVHEGFYQDVTREASARFDAILFDPYPVTKSEWWDFHLTFMPTAKQLLRPGGTFVYFIMQTSRFSDLHSDALLSAFDDVHLFRVNGLEPPPDCEYWSDDHMVLASGRVAQG